MLAIAAGTIAFVYFCCWCVVRSSDDTHRHPDQEYAPREWGA